MRIDNALDESYSADDQFATDVLHIGFDFAGDVQLMAVESNTLKSEMNSEYS